MAGCSLWVVGGWVVAANHGVGVLVRPCSINGLISISTLSSTRVWPRHRVGTQQQKSGNKDPAGKADKQFWTHQSWVHGGTLMYPPTCPPTRMLRQHVSQECTSASYRIPPSSSRLICPPSSLSHAPQLKLALLLLLCTRPKHVFARHSHRQPKQVTHIYSPKHTRLVSPPPQAIQPRFPTKGKGPSKGVVFTHTSGLSTTSSNPTTFPYQRKGV